MAQLYPDEHAQALAELRSCSWHVPEHTVAQLIGFDGDVQNLRAWVRNVPSAARPSTTHTITLTRARSPPTVLRPYQLPARARAPLRAAAA